jgi:hypothetical protein
MSEQKITVELTEGTAKFYAQQWDWCDAAGEVAEACRAALSPKYPEGTFAVVEPSPRERYFARWDGAHWCTADGHVITHSDVKVEPIRTLADDEIAVRTGLVHEVDLRQAAKWLHRKKGWTETPDLLTRMANALAAEADR